MSSPTTLQGDRISGPHVWSRLRILPNPLKMAVSGGVWCAAWYMVSSIVVSTVLFCLVVTLASVSTALMVIWIGVPMLVGTAVFIRGCVAFERGRVRAVVPEGLPRLPPAEVGEGFFGLFQARWRDRVTLRGLSHFTLLYVPLLLLDTVVWSIWMSFLSSVSIPIWYRYIPGDDAHEGQHGLNWIGFWIDDDAKAVLAAVLGVLGWFAWNYVLVAAARVRPAAVRSVIIGYDPLDDARRVLAEQGPLARAAQAAGKQDG